jgi:diadenosine tetraphosphate (Ap4A) HIT family hydrolase
MLQATLSKFQYPDSLIKEYNHWYLLVRPMQVTLGSLILITKNPDNLSFADLQVTESNELIEIVKEIEISLNRFVSFEKINYLMLMMSDPEVHFHIIPRYSTPRLYNKKEFTDTTFPAAPDLSKFVLLDNQELKEIAYEIKKYL